MHNKKEFCQHVLLWLSIGLFASTQIYLGYINDVPDFIVELFILATCLSLLIEIGRLKLGWKMSLGWTLYAGSLIADVIDEYHISDDLYTKLDFADDILKLGIVFIGIAFYHAIKEKRWLINSLQLEVEYRRELEDKLNNIANHDELTGIFNRRAFFQFYDNFIQHYTQPQLIFIDLDSFKQLNDTQGHQQGDKLLIKFANCLTEKCADSGQAYRFGGDEFVVLYNGLDCKQLIGSVEQAMKSVFQETGVSLSYGCIKVDQQQSADAYILEVDSLMYENKLKKKAARGKDRSPQE